MISELEEWNKAGACWSDFQLNEPSYEGQATANSNNLKNPIDLSVGCTIYSIFFSCTRNRFGISCGSTCLWYTAMIASLQSTDVHCILRFKSIIIQKALALEIGAWLASAKWGRNSRVVVYIVLYSHSSSNNLGSYSKMWTFCCKLRIICKILA